MNRVNVFVGETHERHAAELCLRIALKKFEEGDYDFAIHRAEEAIRSLRELKKLNKKAN